MPPSPGQPRVLGEHTITTATKNATHGSAPRARGTLHGDQREVPRQRVSPACAGNTWIVPVVLPVLTGQPRVRGEHSNGSIDATLLNGSAPRARGTLLTLYVNVLNQRVSPACAGNTFLCLSKLIDATGQPRVRGEHRRARRLANVAGGSAPRARGTHPAPQNGWTCLRVSPACAGNTERIAAQVVPGAGQPRVRGEHGAEVRRDVRVHGSAPRARGTPVQMIDQRRSFRVSPACAGNTELVGHGYARKSGQPRVRGEHRSKGRPGDVAVGSAPRARGTLQRTPQLASSCPLKPRFREVAKAEHGLEH